MRKGRTRCLTCSLVLVGCMVLLMISSDFSAAQPGGDSTAMITSGYVDFFFSKNFARPESQSNKFRNFDIAENQFDLSLAELVFQRSASPIGFRIDAAFGSTNDVVHSGTQSTLNNLQQAYVTVVAPVGSGLTVDIGKFVTHMGAEVIVAKDNWNYGRSLLFAYAIPYYHVGLRASYPLLTTLSVTGYLYNRWNNVVDNNRDKTLGISMNFSPTSNLSVIGNWIGGREQPDSVRADKRNVFDAIVNVQAGEHIALGVNADYGFERVEGTLAVWKGMALYGKYAAGGGSTVAVRGEVYSDLSGYTTGVSQELKELTITFEQRFFASLILRAEYRHDWSTVASFDDNTGVNDRRDQDTFVLGSMITF